jgi:hypothetical protein
VKVNGFFLRDSLWSPKIGQQDFRAGTRLSPYQAPVLAGFNFDAFSPTSIPISSTIQSGPRKNKISSALSPFLGMCTKRRLYHSSMEDRDNQLGGVVIVLVSPI